MWLVIKKEAISIEFSIHQYWYSCAYYKMPLTSWRFNRYTYVPTLFSVTFIFLVQRLFLIGICSHLFCSCLKFNWIIQKSSSVTHQLSFKVLQMSSGMDICIFTLVIVLEFIALGHGLGYIQTINPLLSFFNASQFICLT